MLPQAKLTDSIQAQPPSMPESAVNSGPTPQGSQLKSLLIVTDAWQPQVNGVVRTLGNTRSQLEQKGMRVEMLTPQSFRTLPCPSYPEIRLSLTHAGAVRKRIESINPDALHIATEALWVGPRGASLSSKAGNSQRLITRGFPNMSKLV